MDKKDIDRTIRDMLQTNNITKSVRTPRKTLYISDGEGGSSKFYIKSVDKQVGFTTEDISTITNCFLKSIEGALASGEEVALRGFGTFKSQYRAARKLHSFMGESGDYNVEAKFVPKFTPGNSMRRAVRLWEASKEFEGCEDE